MASGEDTRQRAQSSELSAGTGFTFEDAVSGYYLCALLDEGYAAGIDSRIVRRVAFQQRSFGEPLDDLVVDFRDSNGGTARLSLQIKRSLTISAAPKNDHFREVVQNCWLTFKKPDFRQHADRYGAAVDDVAKDKARALIDLCETARESSTVGHFAARFAEGGNASEAVRSVRDDIAALLATTDGIGPTEEELHGFLSHLVLLKFDFLHDGAATPPDIMTRLRGCLAAGREDAAPFLWKTLCQIVRNSGGKAGEYDRPRLVRTLNPLVRLRGAPSLRGDLEKLALLARSWADDIANDVDGVHLDRPSKADQFAELLTRSRFIQIRGLPGSGKSVLLRQRLDADLARGPVLFLKSGRLEGKAWASFATLQGLSAAPLADLLVEISATGCSILFIDGIDRIERDHQPIVLDVLKAIFGSPLLDDWRIVVSLRDTGIEPLRNWLGDLLRNVSIGTIDVGALDDDEAKILAEAKPHLRALLFGSQSVREIVRRPFFAKILGQTFATAHDDSQSHPQSEVDLIEHWWLRGGYNAEGQAAISRQRALIEMGTAQARQLSRLIALNQLTAPTVGVLNDLVADGIVRYVKRGHTVRFAHDILFEWSFFHVLSDEGDAWLEELGDCGEPPAMARVVELLSQQAYASDAGWSQTLHSVASSKMRSQWTRAWLLGPITASSFSVNEAHFADAAATDDFYFMRKALVWFQAERTSPNPTVLAGDLPPEQRVRYADYLGWPSDFSTWTRFIGFLLNRIDAIPASLYPSVLSVFEVWQNALSMLDNPVSSAIVAKCATWLGEIDTREAPRTPDDRSRWDELEELGEFRKGLLSMVLRSAVTMPAPTDEYLKRIIAVERLRAEQFSDVVGFSPILARSHPKLLVELTLKHLREELPDDKVARERRSMEATAQMRKDARAKPAGERTRRDKAILAGGYPLGAAQFSAYDWNHLCIDHDVHNFFPASPLREPFHSLFRSSPQDAITLLRELCNHAAAAWRQLHRHIRESRPPGTPIPLAIQFPWGSQEFWGGDREYLMYRGIHGPEPLTCGFMALEDWCFSELDRGRPVDELIRQVVEGNECIAILGVAVLLSLATNQISETVLSLVTAQRLWSADRTRLVHDVSGASGLLLGFTKKADIPHAQAVKAANARPVRNSELRWLVPMYVLNPDFGKRARNAILAFKKRLPYEYEEQRNNSDAREYLTKQALEYAELAEVSNYRAREVPDKDGYVEISHVSPSAALPENVARAERAALSLRENELWTWASKTFENGRSDDPAKVSAALDLAHQLDSDSLYAESTEDQERQIRQGAVAAVAAIVLCFRDGRSAVDLMWAREVLKRAAAAPDRRGGMWIPQALIPWHACIFVVRGIAADLRLGTAEDGAAATLLKLVAHPLELVSLTALEEVATLWSAEPKLVWAALHLSLTLCRLEPTLPRAPNDATHTPAQIESAMAAAVRCSQNADGWTALPVPPEAWIEAPNNTGTPHWDSGDFDDDDDFEGPRKSWTEPSTHWYSQYAAKILHRIPYEDIVASEAKAPLLAFMAEILHWTVAKNCPPWVKKGRRDRESSRLFEWNNEVGSCLGRLCGLLPIAEVRSSLLEPMLALEGETCWGMLDPFVSAYVCRYVYDAAVVPENAVELLGLCLERFLKAPAFRRGSYRAGELRGFGEPRLLESLMFVSVEHASLAARFVNGNWSEISLILPLVDRFVRAGGWAATVMSQFLTLCERSKEAYPADLFADQILAVIGDGSEPLAGWHGTFIPARIAELVQHFASRETPMAPALGQKLLRVLDLLVDMGDRRSAALQLSESFREIKVA